MATLVSPSSGLPNVELSSPGRPMFRAALGVVLLILGLLLLRFQSKVVFTVLSGSLFSIVLHHVSGWLESRLGLKYPVALLTFVVALLAGTALGAGFLGAQLAEQLQALLDQLPKSLEAAREWVGSLPWARSIFGSSLSSPGQSVSPINIVSGATSVLSAAFDAFVAVIAIFFIGVYGAAQPETYSRALLRLVPIQNRPRVAGVIRSINHNLWRWLVGRIIAMACVALITCVGLWLAKIPLAVSLGLVAGLFTFVEYLGAILSAIPALLIALAQEPNKAIWVVVVFVIAHFVEGYLMTPFITRGTVRFPPAFTLSVQLLMGTLFGAIGLTFATPMAVIFVVIVRKLYVEDALGDVDGR